VKGTEKQVSWAEKIKKQLVEEIEAKAIKFETRKCRTEDLKKRADIMAQSYRNALHDYLNREKEVEVARREDASWWIDHRDNHFNTVHKWAMEFFDEATGETK
jgi:hypothetical protein